MMKYATPYDGKIMARAMGVALPISTKKSVEICTFVKGRKLEQAIRLLDGVTEGKVAVPFRRYAKGGTGHRPGIGPGRYPEKAAAEIAELLRQVQANARSKGLDIPSLVVSSILAKKGAQAWHYGRQKRRRMKRTHIEVVVMQAQPEKTKVLKSEKK